MMLGILRWAIAIFAVITVSRMEHDHFIGGAGLAHRAHDVRSKVG
jgi:hypothetical protein